MSDKNSTNNCPQCGASISFISNYCPYCGHELSNVRPNSSMAELAKTIDKIFEGAKGDENSHSRIRQAILNFPIPNTKADLFEFASSMLGRLSDNEFGDVYKQKLDECLAKIEALYPYDNYFASVKKSAEKAKHERRRKTVMIIVGIAGFFLALIVLAILEKFKII